jgi:hypothetical protein
MQAMALVRLVPLWAWLALVAAGVILWQREQINDERQATQNARAEASQAAARADSLSKTLQLQRALQADQDKVVTDARAQAEMDRTNAAGTGALVDGLRDQVRALQRSAERSAASGRGPAAEPGQGVLAGLLDESLERNKALAAEAERYRTAGLTCQALYQGLADRLQGHPKEI